MYRKWFEEEQAFSQSLREELLAKELFARYCAYMETLIQNGTQLIGFDLFDYFARLTILTTNDGLQGNTDFTFSIIDVFQRDEIVKCKLFASYDPKSNILTLYDLGGVKNQGFGSTLLGHLKCLGQTLKACAITGELSCVDLCDEKDPNHATRMIAFYTKHQFEIFDQSNHTDKKIVFRYERD
jgi:hypothetical protein